MTINKHPGLDVLLIGFEDETNLGLRSIDAVLNANGYTSLLLPYRTGQHETVLEFARQYNPRLIGFSIIFQFTLDEFAGLMSFLRASKVNGHFTAGGHFPSLRSREILEAVPELDTIVRFEGEITLLELLRQLDHPDLWSEILGLAYRSGEEIVCTAPRPLIEDLDSLPVIDHGQPGIMGKGIKTATMLASRGCLFECAFCSIRQFYAGAPGPLRRARLPQAVVDEMSVLYRETGARFFLFQDDDFAARTNVQREWLRNFLHSLDNSGMVGEIAWKISCRVDDLDEQTIDACRARGLAGVYLGVESGSPTGLQTLRKHTSVERNLSAIALLKRKQLSFSIGFMLFDPSSTMATLRENLQFLRLTASDGTFPVNFCKMLPYAGTPIEKQLRETNRLRGTFIQPDYDFLDPRIDTFAYFVSKIFSRRNFAPLGLFNRLLLAQVSQHLEIHFKRLSYDDECVRTLEQIMADSNRMALDILDELLEMFQDDTVNEDDLLKLANREWECEAACIARLDGLLFETDTELLRFFGNASKQEIEGKRQRIT